MKILLLQMIFIVGEIRSSSGGGLIELRDDIDDFERPADIHRNAMAAEMFCGMVNAIKHCTVESGELKELAKNWLDDLLSGELDCFSVAECCHKNLECSTLVVRMMIVRLVKICGFYCYLVNGELILRKPNSIWIQTCSDYYKMDRIDDESKYLEFDRVNIRARLDVESDKLDEKVRKHYIENRKGRVRKYMNIYEMHVLHVLYCLIGMMKSGKHTLSFNNSSVKNKDIISLVGADNIGGVTSMHYGSIGNEFEEVLKTLKYLEIAPYNNDLRDNPDDLALLLDILGKTKELERVRIKLSIMPEYNELLDKLKGKDIEVMQIVRGKFAEIIDVLKRLEGMCISNVSLNGWDYFNCDLKGVIEEIKEGLLGIFNLEGVNFDFEIKDFRSVGLAKVVNDLNLKYVGIECYNHGFDTIEEFLRAIVGRIEKVAIYAGRKNDEVANIARKVLNETSGDRVVEVVIIDLHGNASVLSNREKY